MKNYFQILGLTASASESEIRSAYRSLAKRYHPDVNKQEDAKAIFIQINEAYEVLSNTESRMKYLERLKYQSAPYTPAQQAAREKIYKDWVHQQHREALKRKVAEMRKQEEERRDFMWYYFGALKVVGYILMGIVLLVITFAPVAIFISEKQKPNGEVNYGLFIPALMGASFIGYFVYHTFFLSRRKKN